MIIVAESGSTKTNWFTGDKQEFHTMGFNPLFHKSDFIYQEMMKNKDLVAVRDKIDKVFFYGASCSSPERKQVIADAMKPFFEKATVIKVDHDLKAAALGTYLGKPGITCILGTGSNSCLYDGEHIHQQVPALGYVLGDEGSAAYFGKKLMALFLYDRLPEATTKLLAGKYGLSKEVIIDKVYKQANANVFLASHAVVMSESPDKQFMNELAFDGFSEFFEYHVCCFENYKSYPVSFVGSIAYFHEDVLRKVAAKFGNEFGVINRSPGPKLLEYHLENN